MAEAPKRSPAPLPLPPPTPPGPGPAECSTVRMRSFMMPALGPLRLAAGALSLVELLAPLAAPALLSALELVDALDP